MHCGRGRRLAVSYAIECHGGAMPRTPFCCFAALSLKGKQEIELESLCVKCALCHSGGSPLWWLAPPPLPLWEACHTILRSLALPYSTAITDSLDSQVAFAPLRIRFAGVTRVPLPPQLRWGHHGCRAVCHNRTIKKRRRKAPHHNPLNPPAEGGQNLLNLLNPGLKSLNSGTCWCHRGPR